MWASASDRSDVLHSMAISTTTTSRISCCNWTIRCAFAGADAYRQVAAGANIKDLADWMEENVPESLTVFVLPPEHRVKLRTTNMIEGLNKRDQPAAPSSGPN